MAVGTIQQFYAQSIPNGGFENWSGTPLAPLEWATLDEIVGAGFPVTVEQVPGHNGDYGVKMSVVQVGQGGYASGGISIGERYKFEMPGVGESSAPKMGLTTTPDSLIGWYQFAPAAGLNAAFGVKAEFTRWDDATNNRVVVGAIDYTGTAAAATYTRLSIPVVYTSAQAPDSVSIFISSSEILDEGQFFSDYEIGAGTNVVFDDLAFVAEGNSVGLDELLADNRWSVKYEASAETISVKGKKNQQFSVVNCFGQVCLNGKLDENGLVILQTGNLSQGYYAIKSIDEAGGASFIVIR